MLGAGGERDAEKGEKKFPEVLDAPHKRKKKLTKLFWFVPKKEELAIRGGGGLRRRADSEGGS